MPKHQQPKKKLLQVFLWLLLLLGHCYCCGASYSTSYSYSSYDNSPEDQGELSTRHTRQKQKTKVKTLEGLALGDLSASEAAEQVLGRIGSSVSDAFIVFCLYCIL